MSRSYFDLEFPTDLSGWLPLAALADNRLVLQDKVAATQAALGSTVERRVAASVDFLGLAARVLSPPLRSAVVDGVVPQLDPRAIWWQPVQPGPMRMTIAVTSMRPATPALFITDVVRPVMTPLVTAYRREFSLSPKVLWGNVASALNGATVSLRAGSDFIREALHDELAGTARQTRPRFIRNSCCLFYRVPGVDPCADCVLRSTSDAAGDGVREVNRWN